MMPGSPQTNMYFTMYGYHTVEQARSLIRDLKMVCPQQNNMLLDTDIIFFRDSTLKFHLELPLLSNRRAQLLYVASQGFLTGGILAYISLIKGGLLSYIIMKVIINSHRELLLDVQGSNVVRVFF